MQGRVKGYLDKAVNKTLAEVATRCMTQAVKYCMAYAVKSAETHGG